LALVSKRIISKGGFVTGKAIPFYGFFVLLAGLFLFMLVLAAAGEPGMRAAGRKSS
jgi:hypothetical protein